MKFQILILTQKSRAPFLEQLLSLLEPQIAALGLRKFDQVDLLIREDLTLPPGAPGDKREAMRQQSSGEYICFFDDDDLPAPDYISSILPLLDGVDQIGFQLQCYMANKLLAPTYHSLSGSNWYSNENGHYRDISHLNPMRRELALRKPMSGGYGEDHRWADAMRGLVKTEHYVDKILYHYIARSRKDDRKDFNDPWRLQMIEKLRPALRTV
jgi:hypothetical protein